MIKLDDFLSPQQNLFATTDFADFLRQRAERAQAVQDIVLDEMQAYCNAWWNRRRDGVRSIYETTVLLTDANDRDGASEALRAYLDGAWQRFIDDARGGLGLATQVLTCTTNSALAEAAPERPKTQRPSAASSEKAANTDEGPRAAAAKKQVA